VQRNAETYRPGMNTTSSQVSLLTYKNNFFSWQDNWCPDLAWVSPCCLAAARFYSHC